MNRIGRGNKLTLILTGRQSRVHYFIHEVMFTHGYENCLCYQKSLEL